MQQYGDPLSLDPALASRGGLKLWHALDCFQLDVTGLRAADLGCSTGGFTDTLLRRGAASVIAVDTAYGQLAYRLRQDERVDVRERTNALHAEPPADGVDLVVLDLSWTRQRLAVPTALRWLRRDGQRPPQIISLIKPHYELDRPTFTEHAVGGVLPEDIGERTTRDVIESLGELGVECLGLTKSPVLGGAVGRKKSKARGGGNAEWLALLQPAAS
ncbi:MAG: SAM-dependent methyltransferase [Planctomycetota bacterium]